MPDHWLVFEVADTGCGIAPEGLQSLFKEFVQVRVAVTLGHTVFDAATHAELARRLIPVISWSLSSPLVMLYGRLRSLWSAGLLHQDGLLASSS